MKKYEISLVRLGKELKGRRLGRGVTLDQASRLAQISRSTVQRIEAGDGAVALHTLFAYASSIDLADSLAKALLTAARTTSGAPQGLSEFEKAKLALDKLVEGK